MGSRIENFQNHINEGYKYKKDFIVLGTSMLDGEPVQSNHVKVPLKTLNRHGLIAGATGTGKTKTLQVIAERLSKKGIPSLLMDLKGDLSGLAQPGSNNDHIVWRQGMIGEAYEEEAFPLEFLTISKEKGVKLRATISEFGPVLFSEILNVNDTQASVISLIYKYCDDNELPLLDLKDFKKMLQFITTGGKEEIQNTYGLVSKSSVAAILRKIIQLEQQDAERFFGEKSFDVEDLLRQDEEGNGIISVIRLTDIQSRPMLFSTFMLSLLAEVYANFKEEGDLDKPKLCIFIDEAHLIFKKASPALVDQIETIIKLIRSKGVGVFFITQNPTDVPEGILSQLGLKVQHALRAFTAKDRKNIKKTAENYPSSDFYKTDEILTKLGIGEALITCLNEKGIPTPLVSTLLQAPKSRMGTITNKEIDDVVNKSELVEEYNKKIDRESAFEILNEKVKQKSNNDHKKEIEKQYNDAKKVKKEEESFLEKISKNTMVRQLGRTLMRELGRGLLGVLGVKKTRSRRRSTKYSKR